MSDKRLDAFDTGFEYGKGIKTNPVKEKLTVESIVDTIRDNTLTSDSVKLVKDFLKQILNEIIEKRFESPSYYTNKAMQDVNEVFNKYLNEK
jgi:hypothetical protein